MSAPTVKQTARVAFAGPRLDFSSSPSVIRERTDMLIASTKRLYDEIAAIADPSVENVILPLHKHGYECYIENTNIEFLQHVSADAAVRDASTEADKRLSEFFVTQEMRTDVYATIERLASRLEKESLDAETRRFLDRLVRDGRRSGLHLAPPVRSELESVKKRISELSIVFNKNIADENAVLFFTASELEGVDQNILDNLPKVDESGSPDCGKIGVSLKYPDYRPVMRKCKVAATRRTLEAAFNSRCKEANAPILEEIVQLRQKEAQLLGYGSHADFISEIRMAGSAATIHTFIEELLSKVRQSGCAARELETMLRIRDGSVTEGATLHLADLAFYRNLMLEQNFSIDQTKYQEFFPLAHVTREMLNIYQTLLGLTFRQINETEGELPEWTAKVWHKDVQLFEVRNAEETAIGYFYLDLFPREGKYSHAALFPLQPSAEYQGHHTPAVCALVCNFTKPSQSDGRPSLLTHEEVTTYFHEFGHCMHHICAQSVRFARFAGTSVERDFVECPSQMLENWCWEKPILKQLSSHFETREPLSDDMIEKLIASRNADEGMHTLQQLAYAAFDQTIHGPQNEGERIADTYAAVNAKYTGLQVTPDTCMPAAFGHMVGYSASYIGYLWSEVYSADAFMSHFKDNLMDPAVGKQYRDTILAPGGTRDGMDMIKAFLGRQPNMDNFLRLKGM